MKNTAAQFKSRVREKIADPDLQRALHKLQHNFVRGRAERVLEFADYEGFRMAAAAVRDRTLATLDLYLDLFERNATARGAIVHWAETTADVNRIVIDIALQHGVRKAVKSKSMVTEECALNGALEAAGIEVVETDLGEYILQLANEPPSHIIAPVVHKTREQVSTLFAAKHATAYKSDIAALCLEARQRLRGHFLTADMGISGANFAIAETGTTLIVTNEGNGRMVTTLPRVHVAITGIEKIVPTLEEASLLLKLLPRHATGQSTSTYVSFTTGVRDTPEAEGPEHFHIILLDGGRSQILASEMKEILRCIRCGACMNHCPVYQTIGGHAYGWVYPGPMGSILTPLYSGLARARDLPNAATFCNQCSVVCPVKIPLPDLMRKLREQQYRSGLKSFTERAALAAWAFAARRPRLYALIAGAAARTLYRLADQRKKTLSWLPLARGWTHGRDLPAPAGRTFRELYRDQRRGR